MAKLTQEELIDIFKTLKPLMKPYEKGTMKARMDIEGRYELWSEKKNIFVHNQYRDEVYFGSIIIQSGYVGFYSMPTYVDPEGMKAQIAPELLKCLKGKSCFHIKAVDKEMVGHIKKALKAGYELYKKQGWV